MQITDRSAPSRIERAPQVGTTGGRRFRARVARVGVQHYPPDSGGAVLRTEAEVFSQAAMDSFIGIPVTVDHPPQFVDVKNWKDYAVGTVLSVTRDQEWLVAELTVTDLETLRLVDSGRLSELSAGYLATLVASKQPGADHEQTNIVANHVALLGDGLARAGSGARLLLDSKGNKLMTEEELAAIKAENDRLKAELAKLPQLVADSAKLLEDARPLLPVGFDLAGKTSTQIRIACLQARYPKLNFADRNDDFVSGAFELLISVPASAPATVRTADAASADEKPQFAPLFNIYAKRRAESFAAGKESA